MRRVEAMRGFYVLAMTSAIRQAFGTNFELSIFGLGTGLLSWLPTQGMLAGTGWLAQCGSRRKVSEISEIPEYIEVHSTTGSQEEADKRDCPGIG